MSPQRRIFCVLAAACAVLALAAPAQAGRVLVVDGESAAWRDDPHVSGRAALPPSPSPARAQAAAKKRRKKPPTGAQLVARALRRALRAGRISRARYTEYRRIFGRARSVLRRLGGARKVQLESVIFTLGTIARKGRLTSSRMPALFLQLRRNTEYWPSKPFLSSGDRVTFRGSELLFEYYAGHGLQIQPLGNFGKANGMISSCLGIFDGPCRREGIRKLLSEMSAIASSRGSFIAWEYFFNFGGGRPPWMSGMAQATGIQALARGADLLGDSSFTERARQALGAFEHPPPSGVRTRGPDGGVHYLQYSFAPRLYILNAFLQAITGLFDFAQLTGDQRARQLFEEGDGEARRETPRHDTGDWSRYSRRGRDSSYEYHKLVRDFLRNLCQRVAAPVYCDTERRFTGYMRDPAVLRFRGPETAKVDEVTAVRFGVSKLAAVELQLYKNGALVFNKVLTFRKGTHSFAWRPRSSGIYTARLACKELRTGKGLKSRAEGEIEVRG